MNVTITLENQFVVKEERETPNVKVLMLKGDKGDQGVPGTVSFDDLTAEQKAQLKGDPGDDYILTDEDKDEIAGIVVNAFEADTGWVDMSSYVKPSLVDVGSQGIWFRRVGNTVYCIIDASLVGSLEHGHWLDFTQTSGDVATPLPERWRPTKTVYLSSVSQTPGGYIRVTSGGMLGVRNQTGVTVNGPSGGGNWWCVAHGSYLVEPAPSVGMQYIYIDDDAEYEDDGEGNITISNS